MVLSSPKMTTPTLSLSPQVQCHAANAARELDHLARLDAVQAVDTGDAVADRQHLADFRDLGLGPEIRDLIFEDGGDLCGAEVHHAAPFIDNCSFSSLVLSEESTMREPTLTISPPRMPASTFASMETLAPTERISALSRAERWASLSG